MHCTITNKNQIASVLKKLVAYQPHDDVDIVLTIDLNSDDVIELPGVNRLYRLEISGNVQVVLPDLYTLETLKIVSPDVRLEAPKLREILGCLCRVAKGSHLEAPKLATFDDEPELYGTTNLAPVITVSGHVVADTATATERLKRIAELVLPDPERLAMKLFHTCDSVHCIAGWATHLEGEVGELLEGELGDTATAATILLGIRSPKIFYTTDHEALETLRKIAAGELTAETI